MTWELESTLEVPIIEWPPLRNHIPCMVHVIQLALGLFMCSFSVKGRTNSWEAHERNQQFGENHSIDIGKSQRLQKGGNARINKVSAMRPRLAKRIEKVWISRHFESPETDIHMTANSCGIDYTDTMSSKWVHWLSKSSSMNHNTTYCRCEETVELDTGVASASLPITRIHPPLAEECKIQWSSATLHNTGQMGHHEVRHGRYMAIPILDPVDVKKAYGYSASCYHCLQWHVQSYAWHYAIFN